MTQAETSRRPRSARELRNDQRGAIMVIGTFMAFFLTAGMFYILGTGEAILYRERVQDAADAIAFSSAGIHARGMNMIVLINMIMAAILAVLVALKMLALLMTVATAIACVLALIPFAAPIAGPVCTFGTNTTPKIYNAANKYENTVVKKALPALSFAQRVIGWATPYWALGTTKLKVAPKYEPLVTNGFAVSPSMVPTKKKHGLPIEEDDFKNLCDRAGQYVGAIAFWWLPAGIEGGLKKFAGWVASSFPGFFCGGGGMSGSGPLDGFDLDLKKHAEEACKQEEKGKKKEHADANDGDTSGFSFDMADCKKKREEAMQKEVDEKTGEGTAAGAQGSLDTSKMTSKKVYEGAQNGNFHFQVFGFADAEQEWPRRTDKGILIATSGGAMDVPENMFTAMRFAQAEFYFHKAGKWEDQKDDAMWELAWRARLRRIRPMGPNAGSFLTGALAGKLKDVLGGVLTDKLMDGDAIKFILGKSAFDWAGKWATDQAKKLGKGVDKMIDESLKITSWEIIH